MRPVVKIQRMSPRPQLDTLPSLEKTKELFTTRNKEVKIVFELAISPSIISPCAGLIILRVEQNMNLLQTFPISANYLLIEKLFISSHETAFFFQLATGGIESAVYKKLIAPFMNDLPVSDLEGFRRVCDDHKYAYFGPNILNTKYLSLPCQLVSLSEPNYREAGAFIISKNSPYKDLINWR
jgi:hypothetical protein